MISRAWRALGLSVALILRAGPLAAQEDTVAAIARLEDELNAALRGATPRP